MAELNANSTGDTLFCWLSICRRSDGAQHELPQLVDDITPINITQEYRLIKLWHASIYRMALFYRSMVKQRSFKMFFIHKLSKFISIVLVNKGFKNQSIGTPAWFSCRVYYNIIILFSL